MEVKREDMNENTQLKTVVMFLEAEVKDKFPRSYLGDYEQGKGVGKLELLDMLKSICSR